MSTKETVINKISIEPKNGDFSESFDAEILYRMFDVDGSQLILLKTPRRESVEQFLHDELVEK